MIIETDMGSYTSKFQNDLQASLTCVFQCLKHNLPIQSFCVSCQEFTCRSCSLLSSDHNSHELKSLEDAAPLIEELRQKQTRKLRMVHDRMEESIQVLKKEIELLNEKIAYQSVSKSGERRSRYLGVTCSTTVSDPYNCRMVS